MAASRLIRLAVRVSAAQAGIVLAELLELAPGGLEEVELADGIIEYAIYGAPGELPTLPALRASAGDALVEVVAEEVRDGWEERWREFHRPLVLGTRLTVRPPWEPAGDTELDLVIDPGRAFGTGAHATTRLCLELLLELEAGGSFVDLGCGSGVLAIAAAQLGYHPVVALDHDPAAVEATLTNAAGNRLELQDVRRFDLRTGPPPLRGATVAANLLAPLLIVLAEQIVGSGGVPARLIASGLLSGEADHIVEAFAARGLRETARREHAGWEAVVLEEAPRGARRSGEADPGRAPRPAGGGGGPRPRGAGQRVHDRSGRGHRRRAAPSLSGGSAPSDPRRGHAAGRPHDPHIPVGHLVAGGLGIGQPPVGQRLAGADDGMGDRVSRRRRQPSLGRRF